MMRRLNERSETILASNIHVYLGNMGYTLLQTIPILGARDRETTTLNLYRRH